MKAYYDFHIHSALSPCGDMDMTPNNIVNMALLKELDIIAVSDHNSALNLPAVLSCAKDSGLLVVPGMEVESAEEVHLLCLFPDLDMISAFGEIISQNLPDIKNRTEIFGEQVIFDEQDHKIGMVDNLLVTAARLSIEEVKELCGQFGGVMIPAHVDKSAYSILSNLGFISPELGVSTVEISRNLPLTQAKEQIKEIEPYRVISDSDAHYLWDISEREHYLELPNLSIKAVLETLKQREWK